MSRKAFKRALGDLYKKREIYFEGENTYLTKK
jgi:predicted RNA-binding protein (virulence factor B family)